LSQLKPNTQPTVHLIQNILKPDGSNRGHAANLLTAAYAARRILFPAFMWQLTDRLLDLLSHVEWIRETAVSAAQTALLWNRYYTRDFEKAREAASGDEERRTIDEQARTTLLSDDEAKRIARVADESQRVSHRSIYLYLILDFIKLVRGCFFFFFFFFFSGRVYADKSTTSTSTISGPLTIYIFSTSSWPITSPLLMIRRVMLHHRRDDIFAATCAQGKKKSSPVRRSGVLSFSRRQTNGRRRESSERLFPFFPRSAHTHTHLTQQRRGNGPRCPPR
jgi:hypothetical protein